MIAPEYFNNHIAVEGEIIVKRVPNDTGSVVVWNSTTKKLSTRTHAEIVSDLNLMTTDTDQGIYGRKEFYTLGGNSYTNTRLRVAGFTGNNAIIGFNSFGAGVGTMQFDGTQFYFTKNDVDSYAGIKAESFIKDGGTGNNLLKDDGSTIAIPSLGTTHTHQFLYSSDSGIVDANTLLEDYKFKFNQRIENESTNMFPVIDNANAVLSIASHPGGYGSQIGFNDNQGIFFRGVTSGNYGTWKQFAFRDWVTNQISSAVGAYLPLTGGSLQGRLDIMVPNGSNFNSNAHLALVSQNLDYTSIQFTTPSTNYGQIIVSNANGHGVLELQPFGGDVKVNGQKIWKQYENTLYKSVKTNKPFSVLTETDTEQKILSGGLYVGNNYGDTPIPNLGILSLGVIENKKGFTKTGYYGNSYGSTHTRFLPTEYSVWNQSVIGAIVIEFPDAQPFQEYLEISVTNIQYAQLPQKLKIHIYSSIYATVTYENNTGTTNYITTLKIGLSPSGKRCVILNDITTEWSYPQIIVDKYVGGSKDASTGDWNSFLITDLSGYTIQHNPTISNELNTNIANEKYFNNIPINYTGNTINLNNVTKSGFYSIGHGTLNSGDYTLYTPQDGSRMLLHYETEGIYTATQIQSERYNGNLVSRVRTDGGWQPWVRHWATNDFTLTDVNNWKNFVLDGATQTWVNQNTVHAIYDNEGNYITDLDSLNGKTQIGSINANNNWWHTINIQHRNGTQDGSLWASQLRIDMTGGTNRFQFRQRNNGNYNDWKTIYHNENTDHLIKRGNNKESLLLSDLGITDLNNLQQTGIFRGATLLNAPKGSLSWFFITCEYHYNGWATQTAVAYGTDASISQNRTFKRALTNGNTWSDWEEMWSSVHFTQTDVNNWNNMASGNYWQKFSYGGYIGLQSPEDFAFWNGVETQRILSRGILASDKFADRQYIPDFGIYSKGNIKTGGIAIAQNGFQNTVYVSGRNRIWSFANSDQYGISYQQGEFSVGGNQYHEGINFHFGDSSNFKVHINNIGELYARSTIYSDLHGNSNEWKTGYNRSISTTSYSHGDNGDVLNLTTAEGGVHNPTKNGFKVLDTRYSTIIGNPDTNAGYLPNGNVGALDNRVSSIFHTSSVYGGDWASSLIVKGWSGNYKAWRLTGTAGANDEEDDLFLSNTKTSDGSWYPERKILTTKHLSQSTIDNLNTISNGTLLRGTAVNTNFDEHENKFGWINGTTSQLGGITSWTGNWITIGSAPGNGHKSQLLLSKGRLLFRTMHGIEDVNFNEVIHDGNLTTTMNSFLPTYLQNLSHSINFQNNLGGIQGMMADNDYWRLQGGNNGSNNGYVELATGDDGNEEIYVSQYAGVFGSLTRRAKLLDSLGDTYFPGQIYNRGQYIVWDSGHFNPDNFLTTNTTQFIDSEKTINANKTLYSGFARGNSPNSQLGPLSLLNLALQGAYPLYGDEEFKNGTNSIQVYNNLGNGSVVITHETSSQQLPNRTGKQLRINYNSSLGATPGLGGFILDLPHRANAIFVQKFMAKLPVGYTFQNAENYLGDEGNVTWLTPRNGTGKWETYVRMSVCGHGSSFGNGGHVYVDGPNADLEFYLCFAEAYEVNSSVYSKIKENFYAKNEAIDFTNNLDQLMKVGELSWEQRTVLERGWDSSNGDYIQLRVPGSDNNNAALLMNQIGTIRWNGGLFVSNNLTGGQLFNGVGDTLYLGNGVLPAVNVETQNFRIYTNSGTVLKYLFNSDQLTSYGNINLEATSGDIPDIVFSEGGSEKHRIYDGGFADTLAYRRNSGTQYALLHSGNFSSYMGGNFITTDSTPQTKTGSLDFASTSIVRFLGPEANHVIPYHDSLAYNIAAGHVLTWYNERWKTGIKRGGSTDSIGYGFSLSTDGGSTYFEKVRFENDGNIITQNFGNSNLWNTAYSWGNHANAGYQLSTNAFKVLRYTSNIENVSESGIYRQENPISGYNYTTTLNLNSSDGRQQLTIERSGGGMKFRGSAFGSGDQGWSDWKTVLTKQDTQSITGLKTIERSQSVGAYYGLTNNKDLHSLIFEMGQGPNTGDNRGASIGFFNADSGGVMAGMYVKNNAGNGTHMAFATTNSYAAGPQVGMTLNNNGVVDFPRSLPTFQGNVLSTQAWVNETITNYIPNYSNWSGSTYINQRKVVGELAWKNYGNGHTIFDISSGTTPWGVSKSNVDAEIPWQNSFPTLVGGNGSNTYGVRVDSARIADKVNGYDLSTFSTQTWVNTNFIPKTHPVFNITQNNINTWNNNVMPGNYVTTDTMQIISGPKEFTGSIFASGGISSINGTSAEVFVGNSNTASLKDEIVNDESDYCIRLDPHHYEIDSSGNLDVDDRNRLIHIIGEEVKMSVNFKEIYPKQQIVIYNFDQKANGMQVLIKGKNVYNIEPGCFLRLYVTKSLRVIAERQQPCEFIW